MKTEILRVHNLNMRYSETLSLNDISFSLMEGESTGFWGLSNSGKDALFKVLCGMDWPDHGRIYVDGQYIPNAEALKGKVHRLAAINYAISDWTVAEYIGLVSERYFRWLFNKSKVINDAQTLLSQIGFGIDPQKKIGDLSEIEKRLMDLAKACNKETRVLIIEDEFEGCTGEEIKRFRAALDNVMPGRMTVAINTFSDTVSQILSDQYIILKNGTILKKTKKAQLKDKGNLEPYLLGVSCESKLVRASEKGPATPRHDCTEVYTVNNLPVMNGERINLTFSRHEIVALLALNKNEKETIFDLLSGRLNDKTVEYFLERRPCNFKNISDFVKNKIVSSAHIGALDELMPLMTIGENVMLPSLRKIPAKGFVLWGKKLTSMIENEISGKFKDSEEEYLNKETLSRIAVMFERWRVYTPKVILLLEPFIQCDAHGVALVKSYIKQFSEMGAAVVIVTSRAEHIDELSDCVVVIDHNI